MTTPVAAAEIPLWLDWKAFVDCLETGLAKSRRRLLRPHRLYLEEWHHAVITSMRSEDTRRDWNKAWAKYEKNPTDATLRLLHLELQGVTGALSAATGARTPFAPRWQRRHPIREFLTRPINLKEGLKAGGTLLDSLKDLLDEAPPALKALLTIGKEAVDTVTG